MAIWHSTTALEMTALFNGGAPISFTAAAVDITVCLALCATFTPG